MDLQGYGWMLWAGLEVTVMVAVSAMAVAVCLGLIGSWAKLSKSTSARTAARIYTTVIRGIPELLLILVVYYGTPTLIQSVAEGLGFEIVLDLNPFATGVITIGFIYGAFATEVFRGAFLAIDPGQIEAASAVGMSRQQMTRRIILPQMWRFALPGLGNVWMVLVKATALVSVIQLDELMRMSFVAMSATKLPFTFFLCATFLYLGITIMSQVLQHYLEAWTNRGLKPAKV